MSTAQSFSKPTGLLLALVLVAPMFATMSFAAATPPLTAQQDTVVQEHYGTIDAPYGDWVKRNEQTNWFIHGACNDAVGGPVGLGSLGCDALSLDLQRPAPDGTRQDIVLGIGTSIDLLPSGCPGLTNTVPYETPQLLQETTVYELNARFFAEGDRLSSTRFRVLAFDLNPDCSVNQQLGDFSAWNGNTSTNTVPFFGNDPTGGYFHEGLFTGKVTIACDPADLQKLYGCTLAPGHMIGWTIMPVWSNFDDTQCPIQEFVVEFLLGGWTCIQAEADQFITLAYDAGHIDSSVGVVSDSVRMNMWTEDRFGKPTDQFLNSSRAAIEERRVFVKMVQMDTWGATDSGCATTYADRSHGCPFDNIDEYNMRIRVFDRADERTLSLDLGRGLINEDRSLSDSYVGCCNLDAESAGNVLDTTRPIVAFDSDADEQRAGLQFFEYRFSYVDNLPDGKYRLEFQSRDRLWSVPLNFYVGGGGFDFRFADYEPIGRDGTMANHTVFIQEPTKYHMVVKNNSPSTDTFALTVPVPGLGWTATLTPQIVTLAPQGEARVEVAVVPPPTARPGDIKVIAVTASSVGLNSAKTLYTGTTVSAEELYGVDIQAPVVQALETRPQKSELFPLTVANNGTVRNTYVLTSFGAPEGWVVEITPSFLGAYAGTREAVIVSVTAPAEAPPGLSFPLTIIACPNQKEKGECDAQTIPIKVYLVHGVDVKVLADSFGTRDGFENLAFVEQRNIQPDLVDCTIEPLVCPPKGVVLDPLGLWLGDRPIEQFGESRIQDKRYDHGTTYRLRVENTGDATDTIELTAAWDPDQFGAWGARDDADCEGAGANGDGVPDGWRFQVLDNGPQYDPGMLVPPSTTAAGRLQPPVGGDQFPVPNPAAGPQFGERPSNIGANTPYDVFSGEMIMGRLTLPPHTAQYVWVELHWQEFMDDTFCAASEDHYMNYECRLALVFVFDNACVQHSPRAMLRVSYRSQNDETKEGAVRLGTSLLFTTDPVQLAPGGYGIEPRNQYAVLMETGVAQPDIGFAPKTGPAPYAVYNMVATNTGQEYDQLKISVGEGKDGWTHIIATPPALLAGTPQGTGMVVGQATPGPTGATRPTPGCTQPTPREIVCEGVGVYDAVAFQARAIPPQGAKVGDTDLMEITVASQGARNTLGAVVTSAKTVRSFVQGTFGFSIQTPDGLSVNAISPNSAAGPGVELHGYPGQTIAVPFTIRNVGLTNDRYEVTIVEGDAGWNPQLSQGTIVAVPAGMDYHGFLGITIPDDAPETGYIQPEDETSDDNENGVIDMAGDLIVTDESEHFRIKVVAHDNPAHQTSTLDIYVPVVPIPLAIVSAEPVSIATDSMDAIPLRADVGEGADFTQVEFDGWYIDALDQFPNLPRGYEWRCLPAGHPRSTPLHPCTPGNEYRVKVNYAAVGDEAKEAINQLEVYVPPNQLGVSRVAHRVWGTSTAGNDRDDSWTDAVINLRSTYGVRLSELDGLQSRIVPPGSVGSGGPSTVFNVVVENAGLTPQSVLLSNSPLPDGWQIFYDRTVATVQPPGFLLENPDVDCPTVTLCRTVDPQSAALVQVGIVAPADAMPDDAANILIFATVQQDKTQVAQLPLEAIVGRYEPQVTTAGTDGVEQAVYIAPQEEGRFSVRVTNAGTVTDEIAVTALLPASVKDFFPLKWDTDCPQRLADEDDPAIKSCVVQLPPGATTTVTLLVETPDQLVPTREEDPGYVISLSAMSLLAPTPVTGTGAANLRILDYASTDVDGDGAKEYAIDRNRDLADGYEQFRENMDEAGVATRRLDMVNFLGDVAIERRTEEGRIVLHIHSTCDVDGRVDHFLDSDADGLPDIFWIPGKRSQVLGLVLDVNGDQVADPFIDCEGDGKFDEVYDMGNGDFHRLLQRFIDSDEYVDYVIDVPHGEEPPNGQPDKDETIVYGGPGGSIAKILFNVDMNGDGKIDAVTDADGDGVPDHFIPFGKVSAIDIHLKDVTGDKVADWTYDSTGENGEPNAYYDPTTGRSAAIDTKAEFLRDLAGHWYIFVLFALAMVLFIVLVLVTRRR